MVKVKAIGPWSPWIGKLKPLLLLQPKLFQPSSQNDRGLEIKPIKKGNNKPRFLQSGSLGRAMVRTKRKMEAFAVGA